MLNVIKKENFFNRNLKNKLKDYINILKNTHFQGIIRL